MELPSDDGERIENNFFTAQPKDLGDHQTAKERSGSLLFKAMRDHDAQAMS